jgi:uncharacterized protein (TIGR03085 family)
MAVSTDERAALCDLFLQLGPDAPTLCAGWQTRDLAAHLVVREHRLDAAPGIALRPFAGYTKRVQDGYAARPWPDLVEQVRSGPPAYWPTRIGAVDRLVNGIEFLVHHEDVRRAQPDWRPRDPDPARAAAAWTGLSRAARLMFRRSPVGVSLSTPDGAEVTAKRGPNTVILTGEPVELLLFAFGRDAAKVEFTGEQAAVAAVQGLRRGL